VKADRPVLADAVRPQGRIARQVPRAIIDQCHIREVAVHLVRACEHDRHEVATAAQRVEQQQRAMHVDLEILARVAEAGRDRHLRGQVEHGGGARDCLLGRWLIADVRRDGADPARVPPLQPGKVLLHPGPCQRIIDQEVVTFGREPVGKVAADETGTAGHEDRPGSRNGRSGTGIVHATSPRASSSRRAWDTRSTARWRSTHSASSPKLSPKSRCGA
jgi:hypothetical protein